MTEDLLLRNTIDESGNVIFIKPHAQFPELAASGDGLREWRWAEAPGENSFLPEMQRFIELVGRVCYKSEDRITETSAPRFIRMLVESGHNSVIEHVALSVKYVGSRGMSHQLVRHRLAAFSQESQRYCNYGKSGKLFAVMPPDIANGTAGKEAKSVFIRSVEDAYARYRELLAAGVKPEDARSALPNATKTEIVTTMNLRQWRHVIEERGLNPRAQWEIRFVTLRVLDALNILLPVVFADLHREMNEKKETLLRDLYPF